MNTDDLIKALAADAGTREPRVAEAMPRTLLPAFAFSLVLFLVTLKVRPDIVEALQTWRFNLKIALLVSLVTASGWLVMASARPNAETRLPRFAIMVVPVVLALAVGYELYSVSSNMWLLRAKGSNAFACLASIPIFGLAPLAAIMIALRKGAPKSPVASGAAAGLLAGAMGAALYATHCWDDSPLFIAIWFSIALSGMSVLGAILGSRLLRW